VWSDLLNFHVQIINFIFQPHLTFLPHTKVCRWEDMSTDIVSSEVAMLADRVSSDNSKVDRYRVPSDIAMLADSGCRQT